MFIRQWTIEQCTEHFETLARKHFRRTKSGPFWYIRQLVRCWLSDGLYDASAFEETLRSVFGSSTRMFGHRDNGRSTRVAVTATTISDALPYVFSNYNGIGERRRGIGKTSSSAEGLLISVVETYMCLTLIIIVRQVINTYVRKTKKMSLMYGRRKLSIHQALRPT